MTQSVGEMIKENGFRLQKSGIMLYNMYVPEKQNKKTFKHPAPRYRSFLNMVK